MALDPSALCTLALVKEELGITGSASDARIERLINVSSNAISRYCATPSFHHEATRVEDVGSFGGPQLFLKKTPLNSITSIIYDPDNANQTVDSDLYSIEGDRGVVFRRGWWEWTSVRAGGIISRGVPGTEERLYRVTYDCGYITREEDAINYTIPASLEDAAIAIAADRFSRRAKPPGLTGEKLGAWSVSYGWNTDSGFAEDVTSLLRPFRKVGFS